MGKIYDAFSCENDLLIHDPIADIGYCKNDKMVVNEECIELITVSYV